jgi:regulation of enolase protein 1 (concanavalin A-like superfamily)
MPPAAVSFSANGTNAAKNTTATFTKAGNYSFQVVIRDAGNLTVTSSVSMTVSQTLTSIVVAPASASVPPSGTQQFTATARDQFATALTTQPGFSWMVSGGGTIGTGGLFTAGATPGGPFTVTATSGGINGTAQVTVTSTTPPAPTNLVATAGNGLVNLSWTASAGALSYTVRRGTTSGNYNTTYASIAGTTYADNTNVTNGTTYYYVVFATTANGDSANSNQATATPSWSYADVGTVGLTGTHTLAGGTHTLEGAGADIWGTADGFHYAYQNVTGDATITARVVSLENTNVWAKAGVMMRDGTASGARNVFTLLSPTATNKFRMQARTSTGGSTTSTPSTPNSAIPAWVRVKRAGNSFTSYYSTNGSTWTQLGAAVTISMPASYKLGLAVTSHTTSALATAVFDSVTITTP